MTNGSEKERAPGKVEGVRFGTAQRGCGVFFRVWTVQLLLGNKV